MMHLSLRQPLCLIACATTILHVPWTAAAADHRSAVDELVEPLFKKGAIVVGVVTPTSREVYGFGKVNGDKSPDGKTIFEIGSVTKVFTTLLLADAVRADSVKLDDPVRILLPEGVKVPREDEKEIALVHLATHTARLPRIPPEIGLAALASDNPYAKFSPQQLYKSLETTKLSGPLGEKVAYSNLGMGFLGHALVLKAGAKSYDELVVKRICEPLGMSDTRVVLSATQKGRFPAAYNSKGKPTSHWDFETLEGAGGLRSTADDMLTFVAANMGAQKSPLLQAMELCHQEHKVGKDLNAPLGWQLVKANDGLPPLYWHNGATYGSHSFIGFVKEKRFGVVVLSNSEEFGSKIDELGFRLLRTILKKPVAEKSGR